MIALGTMLRQLYQVCETDTKIEDLDNIRQHIQQVKDKSKVHLTMLENASQKMEKYESDIRQLKQWMDETKVHLSLRDTSREFNEQLAVQEVILHYILLFVFLVDLFL